MSKLQQIVTYLESEKLDVAVVSDPVTINYLTGFYSDPHERQMFLFVLADQEPLLFVPALEVEQVGTHDFAGSMQAGEVVRIFLDTLQMKTVDGKRHLAPLSVDDATARYLDVSALISHHESEAIDVFRHRFALH